MNRPAPLGEKESARLEFKGRDALKTPEVIARGVVALLNAEGGEVWVGLRDENDRAVAVEPIGDPDLESRRLLDYLVDTIEPPLSPAELDVQVVDAEGEGAVLRVTANPGKGRKPFAFLRKGGRHFVVRVGDRIRPMTRAELFDASSSVSDEELALNRAMDEVLEARKSVQTEGSELFWMHLRPVRPIELDLQDPLFESYLREPDLTGNRRSGWNFSQFDHRPLLKQGKVVTHPEERRRVEIARSGALTFAAPLRSLHWKGEAREIWPPILLEYPVSALRLAGKVYEGKVAHRVIADLALLGVNGWKLRAGTPDRWFRSNEESTFVEAADLVLEKPLVFSAEEVIGEPDRCGYRLIERVYESFGHRRDEIPDLFDSKTGRLILRD